MKQINFKINTAFNFTFLKLKTLSVSVGSNGEIISDCIGPNLLFPASNDKDLCNFYYLKCTDEKADNYLDLLKSMKNVSEISISPERELF